ncbi:major capsid protein [Budviciaceae bacterium BWR-B9]|uniref:Major capsid protein n=1 Tax=Limnobaculum allomyrinae TaxID=2791986 RepID=A0ABS1IVZ4_9GAMM|nr:MULTISPECIES: major capsid protein [Limnobaculum]MBK5145942.1 major capsid protein [Limnobaculum allomyrinae]MBV7694003.1 major capsid protein [Limnobaculum sp. M2-1]
MNLEDMFTVTTLTAAINKIPTIPTRAGELGIFEEEGIATTSVVIESRDGRLFLVKNIGRDEDPTPVKNNKSKRRTFETTHLPASAQLLPSDLQNFNSFGDNDATDYQAQTINNKLETMKNSLEVTREFQRIGALCGRILDSDGSVIYDLYKEFGVTQKSIIVPLSADDTNVRKLLMDAKRHSESKLTGALVTGYKAFCGKDWFDAFVDHPNVQKAYANYQEAADRLGGDMRKGFTFGGIEFEEYNATVSKQNFLPADVARVFPIAKGGVYKMYNAPANYNETVNTIGLPHYAKAEERSMGKGWDLEAQANPLAICTYPEALVELKMS